MKKFSPAVADQLKYYVYMYSHPVTGEIFYVGKGKGNRVFAHLEDKKESKKVNYISKLSAEGLQPKIEILIHGLEDEVTALRVESSIIDLIGKNSLTNIQGGYKSASFGRMSVEQINSLYKKEEIEISDPVILFRINKAFRYSMSKSEIYEYTRGRWRLNVERAQNAKYALTVFHGIIQEIFCIQSWHKAGSTPSFRNVSDEMGLNTPESLIGRYEFIGTVAEHEIREKYCFKAVDHYFKKGNMSPFRYVNI